MKLKNVKFGTKCILKETHEICGFYVGDEVLIHVVSSVHDGYVGVIKRGNTGHNFDCVPYSTIPPIPEGYTGVWVKPEELKRVKDSK